MDLGSKTSRLAMSLDFGNGYRDTDGTGATVGVGISCGDGEGVIVGASDGLMGKISNVNRVSARKYGLYGLTALKKSEWLPISKYCGI